ncbi:Tol-Pal system protein TolB [Parachlamydia sp. AcF125]|uniref:Tol-Pal system protein TolB n=1 Tax=Parachlamydia sp. AcF125 TaxID=2795736 RepID=UPI001BCA0EE1|nr:Tol-Pal system protein TolB [Parachlamydia sp. AcF125]MBS4167744.1 Protein TolB [Parachlamydia sp. AcF125]
MSPNKMLFSLLFMCLLISQIAFALEEGNNFIVRLNTEDQLVPLYVAPPHLEQPSLDAAYIKKLASVLIFDLNHSGMSYVCSSEKRWDALTKASFPFTEEQWKTVPFYAVVKLFLNQHRLSGEVAIKESRVVKRFEGVILTGNLNDDRRVIHQIADSLYQELFHQPGIATSRILYTVKTPDYSTHEKKWTSEIWEADYDGYNPRKLTTHKTHGYCVTPSYIPAKPGFSSGNMIYTSYKNGQPKIYLAQVNEGVGRRLNYLRGNQLMPRVSPQRNQIAFICDAGGNPDLFIQSLSLEKGTEGKPRQIFSCGQSVQGTPTFSPNGKQIAFVSNKDGSPRIYILDIPGENVLLKDIKPKLLTKYSRESTAPAWSPDGTKIAYSSLTQGTRQIWIYDLRKQEEKQVTFGSGNKENPSWSPNSKMLIYNCTDSNSNYLYLVGLQNSKPTKVGAGEGEKHYPFWGG